jgi:hypothetical protein
MFAAFPYRIERRYTHVEAVTIVLVEVSVTVPETGGGLASDNTRSKKLYLD